MFKELMQSYYNLKTIQKILLLVCVLSFFMITVGCTGIYFNKKAETTMNNMFDNRLVPIQRLLTVRINYNAIKFDLIKIINLDDRNERQALLNDMEKRSKENEELLTAYSKGNLLDYEKETNAELQKNISQFDRIKKEILALSNNNKRQEAYQLIYDSKKDIDDLFVTLGNLANFNVKRAEELNTNNKNDSAFAFYTMITLIVVALVVSIWFANFIAGRIQSLLEIIVDKMQQVAKGNLTVEKFGYVSTSDVGEICTAFDTMLNNMHKLISEVAHSIEKIDGSSQELQAISETSSQVANQVAETIEQMSTGAQNQAKDVQESAKQVAEIAQASHKILDDVKTISDGANESVEFVVNGQNDVDNTIEKILEIKNTNEGLAIQIDKLGNLGQELAK